LIEIPAEIHIRSTIKPGSVFYFVEETFASRDPHYFVVLNHNPLNESTLLLVCASSQVEKVKRRRRGLPGTTIEVLKHQYPAFSLDSIIDCNYVLEKEIGELVARLAEGRLKTKPQMDISLVEAIRQAVANSPLVKKRTKELLKSK
jgi:hypothetical protein